MPIKIKNTKNSPDRIDSNFIDSDLGYFYEDKIK